MDGMMVVELMMNIWRRWMDGERERVKMDNKYMEGMGEQKDG